jgi:hypothetical protein
MPASLRFGPQARRAASKEGTEPSDDCSFPDYLQLVRSPPCAVRCAELAGNPVEEAAAHRAVDRIKRELGARGPLSWTDGAPDLNRHAVNNTLCAKWYSGLRASRRRGECV